MLPDTPSPYCAATDAPAVSLGWNDYVAARERFAAVCRRQAEVARLAASLRAPAHEQGDRSARSPVHSEPDRA